MLLAGRLAGLALVLTLAGCKDRAPPPGPPAGAAASASAQPVASARRPTRRYYLARTAVRCEMYFADPGFVSPPQATPCPGELQIGERIRIAGKTCFHEGNGPESLEPVVCPSPLTEFESQDRSDAGG